MSDPKPLYQLFHRIADPASAQVRRRLSETGLAARTQFRNVDTGETAKTDLLKATGKDEVPVLLSLNPGAQPHKGLEAIEAFLKSPL